MQEQIDATKYDPFPEAVAAERDYQRARWGDVHDDGHLPSEWALIVMRYAGRLGEQVERFPYSGFESVRGDDLVGLHVAAIHLAAVCAALVERIDRRAAERVQEEIDRDAQPL